MVFLKRINSVIFLSGILDEIWLPVHMLNPLTLNDAFGLAKIQEKYVWSTRKAGKLSSTNSLSSPVDGIFFKPTPKESILRILKESSSTRLPYMRISNS